jgi:omega-amidase
MKDLSVTIIQADLHWENPSANLAMFEELIWNLQSKTDLIVLPEMFTTGFTMNTKFAEPMQLTTHRWMRQQAAQTGAVIMGSYIVKENNQYFNRLLWVQPDGNFDYYDKKHLFIMADEDKHFTAGNRLMIKELKGWKICPLICSDLRFPRWSYNMENDKIRYDCLIYVANFPEVRANVWNTLLRARAIENWSYCVGVNRIGIDGKGISYVGDSAVISPKGNLIFDVANETCVQTVELNWAELQEYRTKFPAYLDAR